LPVNVASFLILLAAEMIRNKSKEPQKRVVEKLTLCLGVWLIKRKRNRVGECFRCFRHNHLEKYRPLNIVTLSCYCVFKILVRKITVRLSCHFCGFRKSWNPQFAVMPPITKLPWSYCALLLLLISIFYIHFYAKSWKVTKCHSLHWTTAPWVVTVAWNIHSCRHNAVKLAKSSKC